VVVAAALEQQPLMLVLVQAVQAVVVVHLHLMSLVRQELQTQAAVVVRVVQILVAVMVVLA
jgi:hypothetical protein